MPTKERLKLKDLKLEYFKEYFSPLFNLFKPKNIDNKTPTFLHSCGFSPSRKGTDSVLRAFENIELDFKLIIHSQIDFDFVHYSQENLAAFLSAYQLFKKF